MSADAGIKVGGLHSFQQICHAPGSLLFLAGQFRVAVEILPDLIEIFYFHISWLLHLHSVVQK